MSLCVGAAHAHRIDEYLQATLVNVEADHIELSLRLVPGMQVAPAVIARIDSDGDGRFSPAEQAAYAKRVLKDITITVDGKPARATLVSLKFPQPVEIRDGLGEIRMACRVQTSAASGDRTLVLTNHHQSDGSVYLMDTLMPTAPGLQILTQKRNRDQSVYELRYRT